MSYAGIFDDDDVFGAAKGGASAYNPGPTGAPPPIMGPQGAGGASAYSPGVSAASHPDLRNPDDPLNALMLQKLQRWVSRGGSERAAAAQALAEVVPAAGVIAALAAISGVDLRRSTDRLNFAAVLLGMEVFGRGRISEQVLEQTLSTKSARAAIKAFSRRI